MRTRWVLSQPWSVFRLYIEGVLTVAMRNRALLAAAAVIGGAMLLQAQRVVLILTDGTPIAVSEYERAEGRVRYFSSDRGQWEQVPEEIVDWERTEARNAREEAAADARAAEERRERIAERRARTELHGVPLDDGIYYLRDRELVPLEQVFFEVGRSKRRVFLNVIAPVPVMPGKRTYSIKGLASKTVTTDFKPAFYMRLDRFSRFGISRIKPEEGKDRRIVQQIYVVPNSEEQFEAHDEVEVFRQQLAPLVYKVWPVDPLEPGEYAIVEFTPGESNLRAWDFSHRPAGPAEKP